MFLDDAVAFVVGIGIAVLRAEGREETVVAGGVQQQGVFCRRDDAYDASTNILDIAGLAIDCLDVG